MAALTGQKAKSKRSLAKFYNHPQLNLKSGNLHKLTGEANPAAILSDHEVELLRTMHEEHPVENPRHLGYRKLARLFGISKSAVRRIIKGETRGRLTVRCTRQRVGRVKSRP